MRTLNKERKVRRLKELSVYILDAIWNEEPTKTRTGLALRMKDIRLLIGGKAVDVHFVEQNPKKSSRYARRARKGERIAWGFVDGQYTLRVSDTEGIVVLRDV